jgi:hypothetical protein
MVVMKRRTKTRGREIVQVNGSTVIKSTRYSMAKLPTNLRCQIIHCLLNRDSIGSDNERMITALKSGSHSAAASSTHLLKGMRQRH